MRPLVSANVGQTGILVNVHTNDNAGLRPHGHSARRLEWSLQVGIVLSLALLTFGWVLVPSAVPLAPAIVLIACGWFWHVAISVLAGGHRRAALVTVAFGVFSALVFVPSALARIDPGLLVKSGPPIAAQCEPVKGKLAALVTFGDP